MYEFKLPDLGEGIHEGEVLKWHVEQGQEVKEDEPLVDVETDKAAVTIPSPVSGVVKEVRAGVGDVVTVGDVFVVIDDGGQDEAADGGEDEEDEGGDEGRGEATGDGEDAGGEDEDDGANGDDGGDDKEVDSSDKSTKSDDKPKGARKQARAHGRDAKQPAQPDTGERKLVPAAPATRRLARELGVDITEVEATGPAGRVTPEDVKRHAERAGEAEAAGARPGEERAEAEFAAHAASAIPFLDLEPLPDFEQLGPVEREPLRSIRRKVAHKMVTSKILVPHVAHMDEADVTELEAFRMRERAQREGKPGGKLTLMAFVIKAVTAGLRAAPAFNASLDPFREEIIYKKFYNIGFAADTGRGLVVPVVHETERRSIINIAAEIEDLVKLAREGAIPPQKLRGGTFTITNVGPLGGTALIPAINYPEVAILGMGRVQDKPVVRDGEIVVRKMLPLTLAFDHRVADGADAARFVSALVRHLSDPNLLLLET